jgi:hybrid cluster-associated redox disulfide protein
MPVQKKKIHEEMSIGEILAKYPKTREVFQKHFGEDCFNCPGSRMETIGFGALMHRIDVDTIVRELNAKVE